MEEQAHKLHRKAKKTEKHTGGILILETPALVAMAESNRSQSQSFRICQSKAVAEAGCSLS